MPFKMHKITFFPEKKLIKKYVCLPNVKFSDPLPKTHLAFYLALRYHTFYNANDQAACADAQAGLRLCYMHQQKRRFSHMEAHIKKTSCDAFNKQFSNIIAIFDICCLI